MVFGDGLRTLRPKPKVVGDENIFPDKRRMRNTRCLTVSMKNIVDVPEDVLETAAEEKVNSIDFSKNQFKKLPYGIFHVQNCCTELVFAYNSIEYIDSCIGQFSKLTALNLACNKLSDLPQELSQVTTLRELQINNNKFENIPRCVYGLVNLEILLAFDNYIKSIDASENGLGALQKLGLLDLRNNNIQQVPPTLGNLKNIRQLKIVGNPFRNPRVQVIQKGTEAIMSYLRDRIPDN